MKFNPIASSSRGNCYLVTSDEASPLLLEAGIPIRKIREALRTFGISLSDIGATLVSHEHQDHAKAVNDLLKAGVDCYMSPGTAEALGVKGHHRINALYAGMRHMIGEWSVLPFPLEHDAEMPCGFFIAHKNERILFIPDTAYVKDRFFGTTIIAIECNNIEDILSDNIQKGNIPGVVGRRIRHNHMNLSTVISMLKANDLSKCRQIFLLHLSDANSNERRMKEEIQRATGIPTIIC